MRTYLAQCFSWTDEVHLKYVLAFCSGQLWPARASQSHARQLGPGAQSPLWTATHPVCTQSLSAVAWGPVFHLVKHNFF